MNDQLLTPGESAAYLKIHVDSVRCLLRQEKLPGVKVGGGWRISRTALERFLKGETAKPKPEGE